MRVGEEHVAAASDGVRVAQHRLPSPHGAGEPVLLVPGTFATRRFRLGPEWAPAALVARWMG